MVPEGGGPPPPRPALRQRRLADVPRAADVEVVERGGVGRVAADASGEMKDAFDAGHGPSHGVRVEDVAFDNLDAGVAAPIGAAAAEQPDALLCGEELFDQVAPEESGGAGDKKLAPRVRRARSRQACRARSGER